MMKKVFALLVALMMVLGMGGAYAAEARDAGQIGNYYEVNDTTGALPGSATLSGDTWQSYADGAVKVNKTIQAVEGKENAFEVTLEVATTEAINESVESPDVATVLVVDVSGSMEGNRLRDAKTAAQTFINGYVSTDGAARKIAIVKYSGLTRPYGSLDGATLVTDVSGDGWVDASTLAKTGNSLCTEISGLTANGGTCTEAGLLLAKNLLAQKVYNDDGKEITTKNVILLTDGKPTYGVNDSGDTSTSTTVIAPNGNNINGNGSDTSCNTHDDAETLAAELKAAGYGTYAVYVGTQQVDCTGCSLNKSGANWLAQDCGFTTYSAADSSQLTTIFETILKIIELKAQAWEAEDPMGTMVDFNEFSQTPNPVNEFVYSDGTIDWDIKSGSIPYKTETKDGVTTYYYKLTYQITLDTLNPNFVAGQAYPTNGVTGVTYLITGTDEDGNLTYEDGTAYFNVPSVKSYQAPAFAIKKVDANTQNPLAGAQFTLAHSCTNCGSSTSWGPYTGVSAADGSITFTNASNQVLTQLPSGHQYTLTETVPPTGYIANNSAVILKVNNGTITYEDASGKFSGSDGNYVMANDPTLTTATVAKVWDDSNNQSGMRPASLTVVLSNGAEVVLNEGNGWSKTVENLPAYEDGKPITYTWSEKDLPDGYTLTGNSANGTVTTLTNTRNTGNLEVTKTINGVDASNLTGLTFTVTDAAGTVTKTAKYSDFIDGKYTFTDLPTGEYTVTEGDATVELYNLTQTPEGGKATATVTKGGVAKVEFVNSYERKVGNLKVTKAVASDLAEDKTKDFTFTVELSDKTINGTYGEMTFTNGQATFTLKDGGSKTATGLPTEITFTVTEATADGFTTTKEGETGKIAEGQTPVASFTNTRQTGDLTVSKKLVSDLAADKDQVFTFTVKLSAPLTKTYSDVAFTNGEATITLKGGESKTISGLPTGVTYTVTEDAADGFQITEKKDDTGTISTTASTASITNARKTGGLEVKKNLRSDLAADADREFTFTIELDDKSITGTYSGVEFKQGVATITLKGGESQKIEGLPTNLGYKVTEKPDEDFDTEPEYAAGTITDEGAIAVFTNTRKTGTLTVSKTVVSDLATDANKEFKFVITLGDDTISGNYSDVEFKQGEAIITLKGGESKTIEGLPTDATYTVTEQDAPGFICEEPEVEGVISTEASVASFTNTRTTGKLEISKEVVSDLAADKDQVFTFTIELSDTSISKTYSGVAFTNGVATITLKGGESKLIEGLPTELGYTVTEADADGFQITDKTGDKGEISVDTQFAAFTNTRDKGGLTVSKTVVSDLAADKDQVFTFTIELSDTSISNTYSGVAFTNGVATITLKGGESKTIEGLPTEVGYTVTEETADGFTTTKTGDTGAISKTASTAAFTNTRETGALEVTKTVASDKAADKEQVFNFTIELSDTSISNTYSGVAFTNGKATITLKGGESKLIEGLPTEVGYTVTEETADGFTTTKTGETGTISKTASTAAFTNTRETGALVVTKTVVSDKAADKDQSFTFTVELSDTSINGTYGGMTFENGVATFTLKHGESKMAANLPTSVTYTVTEKDTEGFTTTQTGETGRISKEDATAAFTNTRKTGELEVTKSVNSDRALDKLKDFEFTVMLDDTTINGKYGDMTFENGVAKFELSNGKKATATGLPTTVGYTVTEKDAEGFAQASTGATGSISDTKATAAFTNTRATSGLFVTKTVVSDLAADANQTFEFTVTLDDEAISGTYGGMTFENGVATFTLKGGETIKAENLPTDVEYTVAETANDDFITAKTGEKGVISKDASTAAFTNTRKTGDLTVSKTVVSDIDADDNRDFSFTVTLSDTSISKTYGDMTFANGVASFTLKAGESKTAVGLPTDVEYTVEEDPVPNFTTTANGPTGTISTTASAADFTNSRKEAGSVTFGLEKIVDKLGDVEPAAQNFQFALTAAIQSKVQARGVQLDDGNIRVELDGTVITPVNGVYTLTLEDVTTAGKNGTVTVYANVDEIADLVMTLKEIIPEELEEAWVYDTTEYSYANGAWNPAMENNTASFENTYEKYLTDLTITKEITGITKADKEAYPETLTFTVTGPNNYNKTVTMPDDGAWDEKEEVWSAVIDNLEPGEYTVRENIDEPTYYILTTTANGAIGTEATVNAKYVYNKDETGVQVDFVNDYKREDSTFIEIPVTKIVELKGEVEPLAKTFTFQMSASVDQNLAARGITVPFGEVIVHYNGKELSVGENGYEFTVDTTGSGTYNGLLTIYANEDDMKHLAVAISEVNDGAAKWEYSEEAYLIGAVKTENGWQATGIPETGVTFTNYYEENLADLIITKKIEGIGVNDEYYPDSLTFTVKGPETNITVNWPDDGSWDENNELWTAVVTDRQPGIYTVTENFDLPKYYAVTTTVNGEAGKEVEFDVKYDEKPVAAFVNTYVEENSVYIDIPVTKIVDLGGEVDVREETIFNFLMNAGVAQSRALEPVPVEFGEVVVMYNGTELAAGDDGYEFSIKAGIKGSYSDTIRIYANEDDMPNLAVTIKELAGSDARWKYDTATYTIGAENVNGVWQATGIPENGVTFTNIYTENKADLTIVKEISGIDINDAAYPKTGDLKFTVTSDNGYEATVLLPDAEGNLYAVVPDLEPGVYTVTEETYDVEYYDITVSVGIGDEEKKSGSTTQITADYDDLLTVNFNNFYGRTDAKALSIPVAKVVEKGGELDPKPETFQYTMFFEMKNELATRGELVEPMTLKVSDGTKTEILTLGAQPAEFSFEISTDGVGEYLKNISIMGNYEDLSELTIRVTEKNTGASFWDYDTKEWIVLLVQDEAGNWSGECYISDDPHGFENANPRVTFTNTYNENYAYISVPVAKTVVQTGNVEPGIKTFMFTAAAYLQDGTIAPENVEYRVVAGEGFNGMTVDSGNGNFSITVDNVGTTLAYVVVKYPESLPVAGVQVSERTTKTEQELRDAGWEYDASAYDPNAAWKAEISEDGELKFFNAEGEMVEGIEFINTYSYSIAPPKTGDNSNVALWMALMAMSALCFMALTKRRSA